MSHMADLEKPSLGVQPPAADIVPNNVEIKTPSTKDASSSEAEAEGHNKPEKEKEGSIKDYFVSSVQGNKSHRLISRQRIFKYADRLDILLYSIAITGGVAVGAALPLMTLVFGQSTAAFNNVAVGGVNAQQFTSKINHLVLYFVYLFIARFVIGYVATLCICVAATRTTRALRKAFLDSLLRQEVWYFDKEGNGSPSTQVTTSTLLNCRACRAIADRTLQTATASTKASPRSSTHLSKVSPYSSRHTLWHLLSSGNLLLSP